MLSINQRAVAPLFMLVYTRRIDAFDERNYSLNMQFYELVVCPHCEEVGQTFWCTLFLGEMSFFVGVSNCSFCYTMTAESIVKLRFVLIIA